MLTRKLGTGKVELRMATWELRMAGYGQRIGTVERRNGAYDQRMRTMGQRVVTVELRMATRYQRLVFMGVLKAAVGMARRAKVVFLRGKRFGRPIISLLGCKSY